MSKRQTKIGTRNPRVSLPPDSYLDGKPPPDNIDLPDLCRRIIADPTSSAMERLRAADMLRNVDPRSPAALRDELAGLSEEELERDLAHYLDGIVEQRVYAEVERRMALIEPVTLRADPPQVAQPDQPRLRQLPRSPAPEALTEPPDVGDDDPGVDLHQMEKTMPPGWQLERGWKD
jgi:hypothetical protein